MPTLFCITVISYDLHQNRLRNKFRTLNTAPDTIIKKANIVATRSKVLLKSSPSE